jgi:hypothetical protein
VYLAMLDVEAAPPAEAAVPARSGLARRVRRALVGTVSLLVVLAALAYVFAPSRPTTELTLGEISGARAYDRDLSVDYSLTAARVAATARYRETFYGEVSSPSGIPVSGARLEIKGAAKKTRGQDARVQIGRPGTYRAIVRLRPGRYDVTMRVVVDGKVKHEGRTIKLRNNRSYEASIKVRESGVVTMFPISSY